MATGGREASLQEGNKINKFMQSNHGFQTDIMIYLLRVQCEAMRCRLCQNCVKVIMSMSIYDIYNKYPGLTFTQFYHKQLSSYSRAL